jgi:phage tail sheath protein FI
MPEYLAPGVYVEEVPSGSKPIEGVSTSTAGMVGVTQRGPVNEPTLVTSFASFTRKFGGYLDHRVFTSDKDALPYAVEGFFANGGQRVYITRIVGPGAKFSTVDLYGVPQSKAANTTLAQTAVKGSIVLLLDSGTNISNGNTLLLKDGMRSEYVLTTSDPVEAGIRIEGTLQNDHADGKAVQIASEGVEQTATGDMSVGDTALAIDATALRAGDVLRLRDKGGNESLTEFVTLANDGSADIVEPGLQHNHPQTTTEVRLMTIPPTGDMSAGDTTLAINAVGLGAGLVLRLQDTDDGDSLTEYVTLANDGAADIVESGLQHDHPQARTKVHLITLAPAVPPATLDGAASQGDYVIALNDASGLADGQLVSIDGEFHVTSNVISSVTIATTPTEYLHAAGIDVIRQVRLLRVHARYKGKWGDTLRIKIAHSSLLETTVVAPADAGTSPIKLNGTFGLSAGSVLDVSRGDPATPVLRQRIAGVDTDENEVDFDAGVEVGVQADDVARSAEFDLTVERLNEAGKAVESEFFPNLGVDPSHTRYAPKIVGDFTRVSTDVGLGEAEDAGESELIRLSDLTEDDGGADVAGAATLRLSLPYDKVARHLDGGNDDEDSIDHNTYKGQPAVDPDERTGIYTLENIDDISIVAVPGQTHQDVQNELFKHCAKMRYRFAVLDTKKNAKLKDVQTQRGLYDTTYAALYYPWLVIGDSFGRNGGVLHIPPSGHVAGIYARSDVQRGVHKAPANEVVLGVRDLQVRLAKGEQDILNPRHINCLRDFREMNRGLRVWGARTLSSDPEWKYVNVRRLFLFIEKSIERGTQWAVFEPNAEPLWAAIHRSVTNFLTAVWRDGALEGTKQEEAFFVKVDRTTMTQHDIDNGRLIILVGIAPVKPAEFVIFRISQKTREATG